MKKLLSAVTSFVMGISLMTSAFASSVSAAGGLSASQPNISMDEVLDVAANKNASAADVILDFGNWEAQPGDDVYVDVTVQSNGNAVISMDVRFKHDSPLTLTAVEEFTPAYNDAAVMFNPDNNGASFACPTPEGDAVLAEDGSVVFMLTYHVPEDCPDGEYKIGMGDYFDIYKDNQSNMLKGATINGIIKVGNGGSQTTTSSSTTTTTTTTTTNPGPAPAADIILDFGNWEAQPGDDVYVDV
ncbi:MAG: cohesin domain-containing protein, partial [Eubacterium sp.]|nr:cohesin domain-containing protein [Eubacterium sp.]